MELPGKRIQKWREHLGKSAKEFEALTGIPYSTLKTLENNTDPEKVKPSYEVLAKLRKAFPQLNMDWLFDEAGTEPMLREGRALAPAPRPAVDEPAADYSRGEATTATLYIEVLKEQVADLKAQVHDLREDKADLKAEVSELRRKPR